MSICTNCNFETKSKDILKEHIDNMHNNFCFDKPVIFYSRPEFLSDQTPINNVKTANDEGEDNILLSLY